jgi:5-hydroxyisourate hydrolase-like protein (transthyretin family)
MMTLTVLFFLAAAAPQDNAVAIAGKVVDDAAGKPVPKIEFHLYVQAGESGAGQQRAVTTDENGAFSVSVRKGSRVFVLWNSGRPYLLDTEWLDGRGGRFVELGSLESDRKDLEIKVRLRPTVELKGLVTDAAGQPARDAIVWLETGFPPVRSGGTGEFVLTSAPADKDYELYVASAKGKEAGRVTLKAGSKETRIVLMPTLELKGEAVADDGKPAANLQCMVFMVLNGKPFMEARRQNQGVTTGADGRFTLKDACEGASYQVSWYPGMGDNASYEEGQCTVTALKDASLRLTLKRFIDDWDAPGNIGISPETRCQNLNDYCLDPDDHILACEGSKKAILRISPDDKLKAAWPLGFSPEAIECRADGTVVVAGDGKIALLDKDGKKLKEVPLPGGAKTATGVSGSGDDVFVAVQGGTAYVIYRLNAGLGDPQLIVRDLRGCCGQMDFTSRDGVLYVAANCNFKVQKYDREGKKLGEFGKRGGAGDPEGFDGCCEPKNVCFDSQGNLYTSESGNCCVKKFTPDGKFLSDMGRVKTIRGCVRVSVAVSKDLGRVYLLDTSRHIVRLVRPEKNEGK